MNEEEVRALENPEYWAFERAERRAGRKKDARAVVSVAFPSGEFEQVARAAERAGQKTSQFIREAALEKAGLREVAIAPASFSASGKLTVYMSKAPAVTGLAAPTTFVQRPTRNTVPE